MEMLSSVDVLKSLCKLHGKWGMYIYINIPKDLDKQSHQELWSKGGKSALPAAPFLSLVTYKPAQIIMDEHGWLLFENQEECEEYYWQCVGDDGPTKANPYDGPITVYALTCDPNGELSNENT